MGIVLKSSYKNLLCKWVKNTQEIGKLIGNEVSEYLWTDVNISKKIQNKLPLDLFFGLLKLAPPRSCATVRGRIIHLEWHSAWISPNSPKSVRNSEMYSVKRKCSER